MTGLERGARLRERRDYLRLQRKARRKHSTHFVLLWAPRPEFLGKIAGPRLGITASKKVGNAVIRNRVKRRVRHWFRDVRRELPDVDYVVIARKGAASLSSEDLRGQLTDLIR